MSKSRRRRVVGLPDGHHRLTKTKHRALDYAILYRTRGERLISTAEFSEVSGLVGRRVRMLAAREQLPSLWARGGYWFALETAFLVRLIRDTAEAEGRPLNTIQYLPASDRYGYKERLKTDAALRKRVLLGRGGRREVMMAKQRELTKRWKARTRAAKPPTERQKRRRRVMSMDPFTREDIVVWVPA